MSARASKPVTVTLGDLADRAAARVETGDYASLSEVLRAGLRALEREETALDALIRDRIATVNAMPDEHVPLAAGMDSVRSRLLHRQ
jgi:antitoxin ParD1/3/4